MSQTLEATFDGEVFRPTEVVELKPDTHVQLIVTVKSPAADKPKSSPPTVRWTSCCGR